MGYPPWPNEKSARCFALRLEGLTFAEIAQQMGITRSAVSSHLARHGDGSGSPEAIREIIGPPASFVGKHPFQIPTPRINDDRKHLTLLLSALQEARAHA